MALLVAFTLTLALSGVTIIAHGWTVEQRRRRYARALTAWQGRLDYRAQLEQIRSTPWRSARA